MKRTACFALCLLMLAGSLHGASTAHVHFIHQSTGDNWLRDYDEWDPDWGGGNLRSDLERDGHTVTDNWHEDDNAPYCPWDPEWVGLCALFINDGARLPSDARAADILIIKSCFYPTEYLTDDAALQGWKDHSVSDIVGYFNRHPHQRLIYCSSVPHHRQGENCPPPAVRARGRSWGQWLEDTGTGLGSFAANGNVAGFSAFASTARPAGQANENTLRAEYEISYPDNHMNRAANGACAARVRALVNEFPSGLGQQPGTREALEVSLWPNPALRQVRIGGEWLGRPDAQVRIYDLTGRIIRLPAPADMRSGTVVWDLVTGTGAPLEPGVYVVIVEQGYASRSLPVVVMR